MKLKNIFVVLVFLATFLATANATITSIALINPANDSWVTVSQPNFTFSANSSVNTSFTCELFIDNVSYGVNSSTTNNTATTITANASLAEGTHNWYVNCTDANGTVQSDIWIVKVDTVNASVVIITPSAGENISGNVSVKASVSDATSGVSQVFFWFETASGNVTPWMPMNLVEGNNTVGNWTAVYNTSNLPADGVYNITIKANDSAGNVNSSEKVEINVDNTPPAINATYSPLNGTNVTRSMLINVSATDNFVGVAEVNFSLYNSSGVLVFNASMSRQSGSDYWNYTLNVTNISDGHGYYILFNVTDYAGNLNSSNAINITNITIDNTAPDLNLTAPDDLNYTDETTITFSFSVFDDETTGSGLLNCSLYTNKNESWVIANTTTSPVNGANSLSTNFSSGEAAYLWGIECYDYAGNVNVSANRTLYIDTVAPRASVTVNTTALSYGEEVLITINVTDLNVSQVFLNVSSMGSMISLYSNTSVNEATHVKNFTFQPNYSGPYTVILVGADQVGHIVVDNNTSFSLYNGQPKTTVAHGNVSVGSESFAQMKPNYSLPVPFYPGDPNNKRFMTNISGFEAFPMFTDKPFFAGPTVMENLAYNYTFVIDTTNLNASEGTVSLNISVPGGLPAYVQNITIPTPEGNQTVTMIMPATADPTAPNASFLNKYSVYVDGVLYDTNTSANVSGYIAFDNSSRPLGWFILNLSGLTNTTNYTVTIPIATMPPIFINSQRITGFDPINPPVLGSNITTEYVVNVSSWNQWFIPDNMSLVFMFPINITFALPNGTVTTYNVTSDVNVYYWDNSTSSWVNASINGTFSTFSVNESHFNSSMNVTMGEYRYQLSNISNLSSWSYGTVKVVKANATLSFPILAESVPSGGAGANEYKAAVTMGTDAGIYINTSKLPNIGSASSVAVYVNGRQISSSDFVVGSIKINGTALSAGPNDIKVVYSVPSTSTSGIGVVSGGGAGSETPSQSFIFTSVNPGAEVNIKVTKSGIDLTNIKISVKNKLTDVKITVEKLSELPSTIPSPGVKAYQYLKVTHINIDNEDLESASMQFKVSKAWFEENGFDPETTKLLRFNDETQQWEEYAASMISSDDEYYYFEASVPGFSIFVITASEVTQPETVPSEQPEQPAEQPAQPTVPSEQPQQPSAPAQINYNAVIVIAVVIILLGLAAVLLRRR